MVGNSVNYCIIKSPVGKLLLAGDDSGLQTIQFECKIQIEESWSNNNKKFTVVINQLQEYFDNKRTTFDLMLNPKGTIFQKSVWARLVKIPFGETKYYGQIADELGNPKASRAIGMANNKNPIPIIIPCHRVIGKNGALTGFAGGLDVKQQLLYHEAMTMPFVS